MQVGFIGYGNRAEALSSRRVGHHAIVIGGHHHVDIRELKYARLLEVAAAIVIKLLFTGHEPRTQLVLIQPDLKPACRRHRDRAHDERSDSREVRAQAAAAPHRP